MNHVNQTLKVKKRLSHYKSANLLYCKKSLYSKVPNIIIYNTMSGIPGSSVLAVTVQIGSYTGLVKVADNH